MEADTGSAKESGERRESPRRPVSWQAGLVYRARQDVAPIFGTVIDVGRAGAAFVSDIKVAERSQVVLAVRLPPENARKPPVEVQVEAVVSNIILTSAGFRCGLQFKNFLMGQEELLKRCL